MCPLRKGGNMPKEYQYKRYQLSLDIENERHMRIISYVESHKAGKCRNEAIVKAILAGLGENIELDLPQGNPVQFMNEQYLKKMDSKLDEILSNLIIKNPLGLKDDVIDDKAVMADIPSEQNPDLEDNLQEQSIQEDDVNVFIPSGIMNFINGL